MIEEHHLMGRAPVLDQGLELGRAPVLVQEVVEEEQVPRLVLCLPKKVSR
jgi:hypothetical protein